MEQAEKEEEKKQLNVGLVDVNTIGAIDEMALKLNAALRHAGHDTIPKRELYTAAIVKYLSSQLSWVESKEEIRREILIERFTDDLKDNLKKGQRLPPPPPPPPPESSSSGP